MAEAMKRFFQLLTLLALCGSGPAFAETVGESQARVVRLENEWMQVDASRARLENESSQLAGDIEHVKAEAAGVRRDFRLRELLAAQKTKADELTRVAADLRGRAAPLTEARRALIANCDRALLQPALNEAKRLELARLRTAQATLLAMPMAPLGQLGKVAVDPLDGPRELKEKADLLRDSGDKLKREVARLTARIDDVERRRHLRERAGAVDEDWFGEATSNRKFARTSTIGQNTNAKTNDGAQTPAANPTPGVTGGTINGGGAGGPPPAGFNNDPSTNNSGSSRATDSTVLRNLVDPATLDELRRADGGDDLERQVRALKRAQGELEGMAAEMERRARSLATRADELKKQK
jgi:hypothetical protein